MKITFLCWGHESMGVEYISACLKRAGHRTSLAFDPSLFNSSHSMNRLFSRFFDYKQILIEQVIDSHPDIVGFSVVSDIYGWACEIARGIKKKMNVPVIFGGIHPTSVPEIVIQEDFVDYVCVGEGEEAMVELVEAIEKGKDTTNIKNIWAKKDGRVIKNPLRPLISNLDSLPFPDKELFYEEFPETVTDIYWIATSRGCLYNCNFCCHSFLRRLYGGQGRTFYSRSIDNIMNELKWAQSRFNIKRVCFIDDLFIYDEERAEIFLKRYKQEIGLPFACELHPSHINKKIIGLLSEAGCATVGMGIQTVSEHLRRDVLNRYGDNSQIISALEEFVKTKIFVFAEIIIGLPRQDEKELLDIIKFFKRHKVDFVLILWLRYYPRSDIINKAKQENMLGPKEIAEIEEAKQFKPVAIEGNSFSRETGRLGNFILFSQLLPSFLVNLIIRMKLYRFFPAKTFTLLRLATLWVNLVKRITSNKKRFMYFSVSSHLKSYLYYIRKSLSGKKSRDLCI